MTARFFLFAAGSYFLGSIPTAYLMGRLLRGIDVRSRGSGNSGATNALRVLGPGAALVVLAVDLAKGLVPTLFALRFLPDVGPTPMTGAAVCAAFAVLGHVFSAFAGFRGGKGVATAAGALVALEPLLLPACVAVFAPALALSRRASVASLATAASAPAWCVAILLFRPGGLDPAAIAFAAAAAVLIFWTHRSNVRALLARREPRLF